MIRGKVGSDFWDKVWEKNNLTSYTGIERYLATNVKLHRLFKRFLPSGNKKILEIGCARGKHLIYFAKNFGYEVSGIDISEKGVTLAKKNLEAASVTATVLCQDIFQTTFQPNSSDIVYSLGLIEHFQDPSGILDIQIKLLKTGGILMATMPNFKDSFSLAINRLMGRKQMVLASHNLEIMDKKVLSKALQGKGVKILKLDYFGPIDLTVAFGGIKNRPVLLMLHLLNQIIGYATFFMPSSAYFSPYLIVICEKTGE
jgi:2-polyprenyl-6-hydroxyphenyl methylase/3-demethylubiquinone-9 3-methyltransferase